MATYHYDYQKALAEVKRFVKEGVHREVFEFPNARVWKWYVGTIEQYQHELSLLNKRKNKK